MLDSMIKSHNRIINDVGVLKRFTGKCFKLTHINKKLNTDALQNRKHTEKGTAGNDGKLLDNMRRTKERIFALAMCNPWEWFVTLTLSPEKYDRRDLGKFRRDLSQTIRDYRKKTGNNVKYLLIPERHKDGCWHMHGFFSGLPESEFHAFSPEEKLPTRILARILSGNPVYTWKIYAEKFGYTSIERVKDPEAVSRYILKYVTKESMSTITELNAHAYYASKGLAGAETVACDLMLRAIDNPDFFNEFCAVKWYDNRNEPESYFTEATE